MTWNDNLLPGAYRGVPFVTETSDGEIGRRVALHEYPLRDKPYAEDLGRKARRFSLELLVLGADYMASRDALIEAFEAPGPGILVHPYMGELTVTVVDVRGPRESTREGGMARFAVTFVEAGEARFPSALRDTGRLVADAADAAALAIQGDFAADFSVDGPEFIADAAKSLVQKVTDRLDALRRAAPAIPAAATSFVADLQRFGASVESLIRAPADLAVEAYGLIADLRLLPDRPERAINAYRQLWDALSAAPPVSTVTAARARQADNQQALTRLVHGAAVCEAVRTSAAIEHESVQEAAALRDELADRLDGQAQNAPDDTYRAMTDLRTALVRDMAARGADRARLVRYSPPRTLPALVLAHSLYGDPLRAEQIVARNRIRHPGFVVAGRALEVLTDA